MMKAHDPSAVFPVDLYFKTFLNENNGVINPTIPI